jgi:hypothetical protein
MRRAAAGRCLPDVPIRLLITARDVAAALHLVQVARVARQDARFNVTIAAQEPAIGHFVAAGLEVERVPALAVTSAADPAAHELRATAKELLDRMEPAAVLVGLSTPFDAGIDEAILAEARVPSVLYQDFWGEQNLILGRGADHILAIDQQAAERNETRFGHSSIVVGSARHAAYATLDIEACRTRARQAIGVSADQRVVGFFGQALHHLPGYRRTIARFIEALALQAEPVQLLVRSHPREDASRRRETAAMFAAANLATVPAIDGPVEDAIAATDVVVSLFSICTFDTAYLNRFASRPLAVPMSLLFDEEIAAYCRQHGNYIDFAHHTEGLVKPVYDAATLPAQLTAALDPATKREVWTNAHRYLPDPAGTPMRVLDVIAAVAGR